MSDVWLFKTCKKPHTVCFSNRLVTAERQYAVIYSGVMSEIGLKRNRLPL